MFCRSRDKKEKSQDKEKNRKNREESSNKDKHDWSTPYGASRSMGKIPVSNTPQRSASNYNRHESDPRVPYPEQVSDRWTGTSTAPARDRFSNTDHKRERFDSYTRIPSAGYHRERDHGSRQLDKRK